jgi:hypothetical protein
MADQEKPLTLTFAIKVGGQDAGTQEYEEAQVTIGKGPAAQLQIEDPALADLQAAVRVEEDGSLMLLDLVGENTTMLNGEAVNNAAIKDGDEIRVGETVLVFAVKKPEPEPVEDDSPTGPIDVDAVHQAEAEQEIHNAEDVMDFVLRSGTAESDLGIDRKKPQILEVAEIWSGTVMNVKHFNRDVPAVYVGDRRNKQLRIVSGLVTTVLVTGIMFFAYTHRSLPHPDRYPQGDEALITKWNDAEADRKAKIMAAKKAAREAELAEITAEADQRIADSQRKYDRAAKEKLDEELDEFPESDKDLAHFQKEVRDDLITEIEGEREEAEEAALDAAQPPDPYRDLSDGYTIEAKKAFEKAMSKNRDRRPLIPTQFELFEQPDWEAFVTEQMIPISKEMAADGKIRKSWVSQYLRIDREYDVYDDLDEKRVVEDLVLGTRVLRGDKVWMLIAGMDPEKVYAQDTESNVEILGNEDEVLLWSPSEEQKSAREALFHEIQRQVYQHAKKRHQGKLKCESIEQLLKFDEDRNDFEYNAQYATCLSNRSKFDQAVEYTERALENRPADYTEGDNADNYLAALQVKARLELRNAYEGGDPTRGLQHVMDQARRLQAEAAHDTLRSFIIESTNDAGSLKSVDAGIYALGKEKLKEDQQEQVKKAMTLAMIIMFILPLAYGFDEIRSRKMAQDFFVSSENLPNNHWPIVEQTKTATMVNFTADSVGFLESGETKTSTADLVASGRAKDQGGYYQIEVGDEERFVNDIGHMVFFIHRVFQPKIIPGKITEGIDWLFLGIMTCMLFIGGAFMITLLMRPYDPSQEVITIPDRFVELMVQQVEKEKEKKKPAGNPDAGEGEKAKDEEGKTGKKEHKLKKAKGSKIAIDKRELDKKIAESTGLLADLNSMTDNSIFGTGGLDASVSNALGGLIGSQYGNQYGSGGLGSRGSGFGGGGSAAGLGGLGTRGSGMGGSGYGRGAGFYGKKGGGSPGVGAGDPIILGALDKSIIDRIVKQHLPQIRYCYQKELNKNPKLFGKIVVKFVISKEGAVSSATTKSSTMKNPIVEKCINARFMRMRFPKPKGGGIVIVSYPFVFNAQGG